MSLDRLPDAVCYPLGLFTGDTNSRLDKARQLFGPVLGAPRVNISDERLYNYATPLFPGRENEPRVGQFFPNGHPLERRERYDWFTAVRAGGGKWQLGEPCSGVMDRVEEVRFGYLVADPHEADPAVVAEVDRVQAESAAARRQKLVRMLSDDPAFRARYRDVMGLTDEEMDERYPTLEPQGDDLPDRIAPATGKPRRAPR